MSTRRGLNRLLVVVTACWYAIGGLWAVGQWERHFSEVKGLADCRAEDDLYLSRCLEIWGAANSDNAWAAIFGSEQESGGRPISCGFPENDEFGFGNRHTLSLEE